MSLHPRSPLQRMPAMICLVILALAVILHDGPAARGEPAPETDRQPISISADQMVADDQTKLIIFSGHVVARQKDMVVNCDTLSVFYQEAATPASAAPAAEGAGTKTGDSPSDPLSDLSGQSNEISKVVCEGHVKITRGDSVAMAQRAVYLANENPRRIVLTGEPRLWRKRDYLAGRRITYFLDEDRSLVEGGPKDRVNAVFYQKPPTVGSPARKPGATK